MRVVAGYLGGRTFNAPNNHRTTPMSEKMKGGLFNALGDIKGLNVLDGFAGSGSLGIEAISRGAQSAISIDIDKTAHRTITENAQTLGVADKLKAIRSSFSGWSDNNVDKKFDLIVADPPWNNTPVAQVHKLPNHLKDTGILVLSWSKESEPPQLEGLHKVKGKRYGDGQLAFYTRGLRRTS